jgi:hypothetical protein
MDMARYTGWVARFDQEMARGKVVAALITSMYGLDLAPPTFKLMGRRLAEALTNRARPSRTAATCGSSAWTTVAPPTSARPTAPAGPTSSPQPSGPSSSSHELQSPTGSSQYRGTPETPEPQRRRPRQAFPTCPRPRRRAAPWPGRWPIMMLKASTGRDRAAIRGHHTPAACAPGSWPTTCAPAWPACRCRPGPGGREPLAGGEGHVLQLACQVGSSRQGPSDPWRTRCPSPPTTWTRPSPPR